MNERVSASARLHDRPRTATGLRVVRDLSLAFVSAKIFPRGEDAAKKKKLEFEEGEKGGFQSEAMFSKRYRRQ